MAALACGSPAQGRVSRLDRELHRRPRWLHSHAVHPPRTALRGPVWSSIEDEIFTIAEPTTAYGEGHLQASLRGIVAARAWT
eukprot:9502889-Pyramimonas_sp.AAC.1